MNPQMNNLREEKILRPRLERMLVASTLQFISAEEDCLDPGTLLPLRPNPLTIPPWPCALPSVPLAAVRTAPRQPPPATLRATLADELCRTTSPCCLLPTRITTSTCFAPLLVRCGPAATLALCCTSTTACQCATAPRPTAQPPPRSSEVSEDLSMTKTKSGKEGEEDHVIGRSCDA